MYFLTNTLMRWVPLMPSLGEILPLSFLAFFPFFPHHSLNSHRAVVPRLWSRFSARMTLLCPESTIKRFLASCTPGRPQVHPLLHTHSSLFLDQLPSQLPQQLLASLAPPSPGLCALLTHHPYQLLPHLLGLPTSGGRPTPLPSPG